MYGFKIALVAAAFAVISMGSVAVTSTNAEARCDGCSAPVTRRSVRTTNRVKRPVRTVVRHTSSTKTRRVRHVNTRRVVTHVRPIIRVRRIHTVHKRTVVYRQNRTVRQTVRHAARTVHGGTITRVVNHGTRYVNMNCSCNH